MAAVSGIAAFVDFHVSSFVTDNLILTATASLIGPGTKMDASARISASTAITSVGASVKEALVPFGSGLVPSKLTIEFTATRPLGSGDKVMVTTDTNVFKGNDASSTSCTVAIDEGVPIEVTSSTVSSKTHRFDISTTEDTFELLKQTGYTTHGTESSLAFVINPLCKKDTNCAAFTVEVNDNAGRRVVTGTAAASNVVLTKVNGSGNIGGTTSATAVAGIATFGSVQIDAAGSDLVMRARVISPRTIVVATSAVGVSDNSIELSNTDYAGMSNGDALLYVAVGSTALGGLTNNNVYYIRKTTGTTKITLYDSRVNASNTSSTSGLTT